MALFVMEGGEGLSPKESLQRALAQADECDEVIVIMQKKVRRLALVCAGSDDSSQYDVFVPHDAGALHGNVKRRVDADCRSQEVR